MAEEASNTADTVVTKTMEERMIEIEGMAKQLLMAFQTNMPQVSTQGASSSSVSESASVLVDANIQVSHALGKEPLFQLPTAVGMHSNFASDAVFANSVTNLTTLPGFNRSSGFSLGFTPSIMASTAALPSFHLNLATSAGFAPGFIQSPVANSSNLAALYPNQNMNYNSAMGFAPNFMPSSGAFLGFHQNHATNSSTAPVFHPSMMTSSNAMTSFPFNTAVASSFTPNMVASLVTSPAFSMTLKPISLPPPLYGTTVVTTQIVGAEIPPLNDVINPVESEESKKMKAKI